MQAPPVRKTAIWKRTWFLAGLSGAALAASLAGAAWMLALEPWTPRQRLPDGTMLKLQGVTYGKFHPPPAGAWWTELAGKIWPPPPGFRSAGPFRQERLVFWFSRTPSLAAVARQGAARLDAYRKATPYPWPCTFSESGASVGPVYPHGFTYPTDQVVVSTPIFPRRGMTVGVRLVDVDAEKELVRFVVPNPCSGPYPVWKTEPLPATRRVNGAEFTLVKVRPDRLTRPNPGEWAALGKTDTAVVFRCPASGSLQSVVLSDATGNVLDDPDAAGLWEYSEDETGLTLRGSLPWDEPAWKVRARFLHPGTGAPVTVEYVIRPSG